MAKLADITEERYGGHQSNQQENILMNLIHIKKD